MFKSKDYIADVNQRDLRSIRLACLNLLQEPQERPRERLVVDYGNGNRLEDDRNFDDMGELLRFPADQDRHKLSIDQVLKSASVQHDKLLEPPAYVDENSNKDSATARFLLEKAEDLLKQVPIRCKEFELLFEQRMAIMSMTTPLPVETYTSLTITRESMEQLTARGHRKQKFEVKYYLEKGRIPMFTLADYATGAGKTIMAVMSALIMLVNRDKWTDLKNEFMSIVYARRREQFSGLVCGGDIETMVLARLCIAYVPGTVLTHWYKTAESAVFGIKEIYPTANVQIWKGKNPHHSLKAAYDSGRPTLWLLPMEAASLDVETKWPNIAYGVRIMDELNVKMMKKYTGEVSCPLFTYITQATIGTLQTCTRGMPRHPMRKAFGDNFVPMTGVHNDIMHGNYKHVEMALDHLCKIRQFAAPEFLRRLVSKGIQRNMPSGLNLYQLNLRTSTIANIVTGSVMDLSFPELVGQMLQGINPAWKDRIKAIFNKAVVLDSAEVLKEIDEVIDQIRPVNLADHTAKQFIMRLGAKLKEIFEGSLPEDPCTLEPIPRENIRLLRCCTAVIDKDTIPKLKNRCPLCRSALQAIEIKGDVDAVKKDEEDKEEEEEAGPSREKADDEEGEKDGKKPLSKAEGKRRASSPSLKRPKPNDSDSEEGEGEEVPDEDDIEREREREEATFYEIIQRISQRNLPAIDALVALLKEQCDLRSSSRVLLCFGFDRSQRHMVQALLTRIRREIARVTITDIDMIARDYVKADDVLSKYKNRTRYQNPQILLVNTQQNSSSVQGLDLFETDLTVVADQCSLETQRQAAGRCLRMQPLVNGRPFGPKNLVVTSMAGVRDVRMIDPNGADPNDSDSDLGDLGDVGDLHGNLFDQHDPDPLPRDDNEDREEAVALEEEVEDLPRG